MPNAEEYIPLLKLEPHPEGGHYREVYRNPVEEWFSGFEGLRSLATSIYFLLREGEISAFHRIRSDEIWYFHDGDVLEIIEIRAPLIIRFVKRGDSFFRRQAKSKAHSRGSVTEIWRRIRRNEARMPFSVLQSVLAENDSRKEFLEVPINESGTEQVTRLGKNLHAGEVLQHVVKAGRWFGARLPEGSSFCLAGCQVTPGFDFRDFEMK